jgi:hypothetical protein
MSKAAYAKRRGVSRQTVYDWIAKGEIVMSGSKIDVEATEIRQSTKQQTEQQNSNAPNRWPHRTLEMTWREAWAAVKDSSGKSKPPTTEEGIKNRVESAAEEMGYEVEFLENGGILLISNCVMHYFTDESHSLKENAWLALLLLRMDLCASADADPDCEDKWSPAGIQALSEWAKAREVS